MAKTLTKSAIVLTEFRSWREMGEKNEYYVTAGYEVTTDEGEAIPRHLDGVRLAGATRERMAAVYDALVALIKDAESIEALAPEAKGDIVTAAVVDAEVVP